MDDGQIVALYWQRDETAIRETSGKYGGYCYAVANNILQNNEDAEECVNDTWIRAWNAIPPQRPRCLRMFLAKITRNLSFNKFKSRTAAKRGGGEIAVVLEELHECALGRSDVETAYQEKELAQSINRFVRRLTEKDCNVFVRRYFYTEPIAEIAKRYGLTENNVTVILSRTRGKLKKYLQQEGYDL